MVFSMLQANGYQLSDYGAGITVDELASKAKEDNIEILLVSTLMLNAALRVKDLVDMLSLGEKRVKVIVGGAPFRFDPQLWREVGADAMGKSASEAPRAVAKIIKGMT